MFTQLSFFVYKPRVKQTNKHKTTFQSYVKLPNQFLKHFGVGGETGPQSLCMCAEGREELELEMCILLRG